MFTDVVLPLLGLGLLAWGLPWALGRVLPEGVAWLVVNGLISAAVLAVVAAAGFMLLYGAAGGVVWREAPWHFVMLSARSALLWAPILVLSLANLPKGWTEAEW
ncbi:hypothetical protein [Jannaschia seohaensis]|uniref:Uncharacterized protein n=1 Tax=Jannaschia seohaensis TaxID=475081 RepID=A0A2Y9B6R7_9RHOB|nr:hypothetical protein [Jannaschia seohaensis]PWJ12085.1 hypothetical protein BCF38_11716 [Jannaschia seohaensis]SSA51188.1 hypothetical protein SAMN05421539_11716 [Jannaschia seohaensis]